MCYIYKLCVVAFRVHHLVHRKGVFGVARTTGAVTLAT